MTLANTITRRGVKVLYIITIELIGLNWLKLIEKIRESADVHIAPCRTWFVDLAREFSIIMFQWSLDQRFPAFSKPHALPGAPTLLPPHSQTSGPHSQTAIAGATTPTLTRSISQGEEGNMLRICYPCYEYTSGKS